MQFTVSVEVGAVHDHLLNTSQGDVVRVGPDEVSTCNSRGSTVPLYTSIYQYSMML
jgi:hypothetical protein